MNILFLKFHSRKMLQPELHGTAERWDLENHFLFSCSFPVVWGEVIAILKNIYQTFVQFGEKLVLVPSVEYFAVLRLSAISSLLMKVRILMAIKGLLHEMCWGRV